MNFCTKDWYRKKWIYYLTNNQGRLSKEEIERIVNDAEKFAEDDKILKVKIDAKNSLDSHLHSTRNKTETNERFSSIINRSDKQTIIDASGNDQEWLNSNPDGDGENYQEHLNDHREFVVQ